MMDKLKLKYMSVPVQVRASTWFLICSFLQKGISVITTPIFTRLLSTSEYGAFSVWNSWLGIITVFVSLNLFYGVYISGLVRYESDRKLFSASVISLNFVSCIAWTLIYTFGRNTWNSLLKLSTAQMLSMMAMIWASSVFSFWSADQRVDFKYRALVAVTLLMSLAKPLVSILLIKMSADKVTARIVGLCAVEFLFCLPIFVITVKKNGTLINTKYWKYALSFNIPLIPHYLSQVVLSSSDRILIGQMAGEDKAGIYNLAYSLALVMTMFNTALIQTLEPWIYKKIKEEKPLEISKIAYISFIGIAGINIVLIYLAPEIVSLFAPKAYSEATNIIPPISMSVFFMYMYTFFAAFEFYYKKTKLISIATMAGALINLVGNYVFIKIYGYQAAAYTTLFCYILYAIFHYAFMSGLCINNFGYQIYKTKLIVLISFVFILFGFFGLLLYPYTLIRYLVVAVLVVLVFINRKNIIRVYKSIMAARKA